MNHAELRTLLAELPPGARDVLRRVARADQWERDELAHRLERAPNGLDMAEIVDRITISTALRQQVVRLLGELEASA